MKVLLTSRSATAQELQIPIIEDAGFQVFTATGDDEAIAQLKSGRIDIAIVGGGVQGEARERMFTAAGNNGVVVVKGQLGKYVPAVRSGRC